MPQPGVACLLANQSPILRPCTSANAAGDHIVVVALPAPPPPSSLRGTCATQNDRPSHRGRTPLEGHGLCTGGAVLVSLKPGFRSWDGMEWDEWMGVVCWPSILLPPPRRAAAEETAGGAGLWYVL